MKYTYLIVTVTFILTDKIFKFNLVSAAGVLRVTSTKMDFQTTICSDYQWPFAKPIVGK